MVLEIMDKEQCNGCAACRNVCPMNCINMEKDKSGFEYPVVDIKKCIDCNLCQETCPVDGITLKKYRIKEVYAAWSKNSDVRYLSTSGGIFSELAIEIIQEGGVVVAAAYNEENEIHHIIVEKMCDIEKIRQSKYAQSRIDVIYREIKEQLQRRKVLFCGTPCQVVGLKAFLKEEYSNLITVDFICRGVNSPKALKKWIEELEFENESKVNRIWFKYKINGWKKSPKCTRIDFLNGKSIVKQDKDNSFMYGYLGPNLYIRPSCGKCKFKGSEKYSDITLGDFWGIKSELDDDRGTSLVLLNNMKAESLFKCIKERIVYSKRDINEVFRENICAVNSIRINPKSEEFLEALDKEENAFSKMVYAYSKKKIKERVRNTLNRLRGGN